MGLTRIAQDPWTETHLVPSYVPAPSTVSRHVPLTPERAEELVKTHLERSGQSIGKTRDLPDVEVPDGSASDCASGSVSAHRQDSSLPSTPKNARSSGESGMGTSPKRSSRGHPGLSLAGPAGLDSPSSIRAGESDIPIPTPVRTPGSRNPPDRNLLEAWVRPLETDTHGVDEPPGHTSGVSRRASRPFHGQGQISRRLSCPEGLLNSPDGGTGSNGRARQSSGTGGPDAESSPAQQDALEPLANHHMWQLNRGGYLDGGMLYSASNVLQQHRQMGRYDSAASFGGFKPRDAASFISAYTAGQWSNAPTTRVGQLIHEGGSVEAVRSLAAVIIQSYCRGWQARRRVARLRAERQDREAARHNAEAAAAALAREQALVRKHLRAAARDCLLAVQAQQDYDRTRLRLAAARGLGPGAAAAAPPPPPSIPEALWERCKGLGLDPIAVLLDAGWASQQIEDIIAASHLAQQLPERAAVAAARLGPTATAAARAADSRATGGSGGAASSAGGAVAATAAGSGGMKINALSDDGTAGGMAAAVTGGGEPTGLGPGLGGPSGSVTRRHSTSGRPLVPLPRHSAATGRQPQAQPQSQSQTQGLSAQPPSSLVNTAQLVEQMLMQQQQQQQQLAQQQQEQQQQQQAQQQQYLPSAFAAPMAMGPAVRRTSVPNALAPAGGWSLPPTASQALPAQSHSQSHSLSQSHSQSQTQVAVQAQLRRQPSLARSMPPPAEHQRPGNGPSAAAAAALVHGLSHPGGPFMAPAFSAGTAPIRSHPHPGQQRGGPGGYVPGRVHSRRMSDFVGNGGMGGSGFGAGGGGGSGGGAANPGPNALSLAAVGSSAVVSQQPLLAEGRTSIVRNRSMRASETGSPALAAAAAAIAAVSASGPAAAVAAAAPAPAAGPVTVTSLRTALSPVRVALPAMPQASRAGSGSERVVRTSNSETLDASAAPATTSAAAGNSTSGGGFGGSGSSAAAPSAPLAPSASAGAAVPLPPHVPQHVYGGAQLASAANSPVPRQSHGGPFSDGGPSLRRHHSFADSPGRRGGGGGSGSNSFSSLAPPSVASPVPLSTAVPANLLSISTSASGGLGSADYPPYNNVSSISSSGGVGPSAAAFALLGRTSINGGGSGRASRGNNSPSTSLSGALPPLLQGQGSLSSSLTLLGLGNGSAGSAGGSGPNSGTASPVATSLSLSGAISSGPGIDGPGLLRLRRVSNLGPAPGMSASSVAAPPPGVPPAVGSPITLRRLTSLSSSANSTAAAAATAAVAAASTAAGTAAPYTPFTSVSAATLTPVAPLAAPPGPVGEEPGPAASHPARASLPGASARSLLVPPPPSGASSFTRSSLS